MTDLQAVAEAAYAKQASTKRVKFEIDERTLQPLPAGSKEEAILNPETGETRYITVPEASSTKAGAGATASKVASASVRKAKAPKPPTEHQEQAELFRWAEGESVRLPALRMLFAIPNGAGVNHQTSRKGKRFSLEGAKLKKEGMKSGVPDVFGAIPCNGYHGIFIEMKRSQKSLSKVTPEQHQWKAALETMGYRVEVCYGWEAAKAVILDYLEGK